MTKSKKSGGRREELLLLLCICSSLSSLWEKAKVDDCVVASLLRTSTHTAFVSEIWASTHKKVDMGNVFAATHNLLLWQFLALLRSYFSVFEHPSLHYRNFNNSMIFFASFYSEPTFFTERRRIYIFFACTSNSTTSLTYHFGIYFQRYCGGWCRHRPGIRPYLSPLLLHTTTRDSGLLQFQNFISTQFAFLSIIWNCGILSSYVRESVGLPKNVIQCKAQQILRLH